ncbi:pullulanase [Bacillus sp. LL01]|uniref:DUF6509 family protein n=1 Tax=Bacillus sp. LL01 TaxID=1665556 RepID=UPI00064CEB6F|nr:DUF6509 family protein [Bacillus sp. LL01]KMJ59460.1 pullulanase [Bacillus sp. LL01]
MNIKGYEVEKLNDPTGIIEGDRYEFLLNLEVDEEDELYSEEGVYLKVIFAVNESGSRIAQYQFYEVNSNKLLDFGMEEEEEQVVLAYCGEHYKAVL